jgi:hypothetical protein
MSDDDEAVQVEADAPKDADDPFTKIKFDPHKGLEMIAPIRPGVLKEIGHVVDDEPEQPA